jgi:hypothetical protein
MANRYAAANRGPQNYSGPAAGSFLPKYFLRRQNSAVAIH